MIKMTIEQLRQQINIEREKQSGERKVSKQHSEERQLKKQLFMLKHRKLVNLVSTFGSGAKRTGQGLGTMVQGLRKNKALNNWARGFK